ncbi:MAG: 1-(5-phosphoribosyl)-5-[(5-phosphoribosylamino)methylideneamino]imidazole-4-carboxamide isomerase [candidate division KSB1 bacterium]|nr:1-(5-phosphoribosyl)-5-[(5-phosphoribosylamino)methylideneamino]imidazole-4-carboxamide isomerase [candidate division KSB1 bacterium]MDZ7274400.1 1-(5-phosphoribosyl)-5-[(5-phosphoribosylamino)methylideneamino]imidazole-4-carboxamide isomerase [candidate division KSB1 bacterium]MDZ7284938.1 1-(5-phosphoribosyl)-5-[(5-phosphoribosylamino)methylideneamino]imidazole-4-carboxamide isomerase [candidate division KSB1 bacterium]MDZ7297641.1 1-(5-phosphoribosyl)-5-[(5-phosphoribosylamino)methylidenea
MLLFPAIDLKGGRCVRLLRGEAASAKIYGDDPVAIARSFAAAGAAWLHLVDLDAAFSGSTGNRTMIRRIIAAVEIPVQTGGGMRSLHHIAAMLDAGARRVVIGTAAVSQPELVEEALTQFGAEAIAVGIDARDGRVATSGWTDTSEIEAVAFAQQMHRLGVRWTVYTDIARDGTLQGPNLAATAALARQSGLQVIAAGGVARLEDLVALRHLEKDGVAGVIVGKALYEGKFTLAEALQTMAAP